MRTKAYITICVLTLSLFVASKAFASEVTGTLSTSGGQSSQTNSQTETHSSEIGGTVSSQVGGEVVASNTSQTTELQGGIVLSGGRTPDPSEMQGTVIGGSSGGISDEEAAHLALASFGARYGTQNDFLTAPGAPDAGSIPVSSEPDQYSLLSRYSPGATSVSGNQTDLTAAAIGTRAGGLSMVQLSYLALLALLILGALGYGVSKMEKVETRK